MEQVDHPDYPGLIFVAHITLGELDRLITQRAEGQAGPLHPDIELDEISKQKLIGWYRPKGKND